MSLIETRDLCQERDGITTLRNINLKIEPGEVFALIGPSGAGKTTLLRLLDLIDRPSSGKLYINGTDTNQPESVRLALRRRMAFLQQKPIVFNESVSDNVAYGLRCRGMARSIIQQKVNDIINMVGLEQYRDRNARKLSGGEQQRVALARALVLEPEILFLDELTANLDPLSSSRIEELIESINHKRNATIVMATHDMAQGQRLANRIGVLINGELRQIGRTTDIFNSPGHKDVAEFVGVENIIPGTITTNVEGMVTVSVDGGHVIEAVSEYTAREKVYVFMRPEDITLSLVKASSSARNSFMGEITRLVSMGTIVRIEVTSGCPLVALVTKRSVEEMGLRVGLNVFASFKATAIHVVRRD